MAILKSPAEAMQWWSGINDFEWGEVGGGTEEQMWEVFMFE